MKITKKALSETLKQHTLWLADSTKGIMADLTGANLTGADLRGADLTGANLTGADLSGADLSGANLTRARLYRAKLSGADLYRVDLSGADLTGANLYRANLYRANLYRADLTGADLTGADLTGADLTGATLPNFRICPEEGAFVAWKKVNGAILKLEIRGKSACSIIGRKCRTDRAFVLEAFGEGTLFKSVHDPSFTYEVGKEVTTELDEDIRVECTKGIHFFMTRKEAEQYGQ